MTWRSPFIQFGLPVTVHPRLTGLILLLALLSSLTVAAEPAAVARYVSPTGNDAGNACLDPVAPCATLGHALGRALPGDTINLAPGVYYQAGLLIDKAVTIVGGGPATTIFDGQGRDTLLTVTSGGALTLDGVTLRGGAGQRGGGVAVLSGQLVMRRAALLDNHAGWGGAVYVAGGAALIEDSRLANNTADGGGAVFVAAGTLDVLRSEISGNAAGVGGGLFVGPAADVAVVRTTVSSNEAGQGGGAYVQGAFHSRNSLWRENMATGRGGGLLADGGSVLLEHTAWLGNGAALGGGIAGLGSIGLRQSVISGSRGGDCAATLTGDHNLLDDATCGLPARPATGLASDGRPDFDSNALDAVPADQCRSEATGQTVGDDLRGQPRPTDGDGDGVARCDIGPYEFQPRLVLVLNPSPRDDTRFDFGGDLGPIALSAARPRRAFEVAPGSYQLAQVRETNWKVTAITCAGDVDGGSIADAKARSTTVDLDGGEAITCTFNERATRGSIGITLVSAAGPVVVPFDGDFGPFELRAPEAADRRPGKQSPGVYTIRAAAPTGWRVQAIACAGDRDAGSVYDIATGTARIELDAKETLGCTFTLAPDAATGTLTIRHEATPADDQDFAYVGDLGPFLLRAPSAAVATFERPPGVYRVHELQHPQWTLGNVTCQGDADSGTTVLREEGTVVVDLDAGEAVECVFRHIRAESGMGSITLAQTAAPADPVSFTYDGSLGNFALALPDVVTRTWAALPPGSYAVRQTPPPGWQLDAITCEGDSDAGSALSPGERSAVLDLDAGEAIVCTFADSRPVGSGSITIVHEPTPADNSDFRYRGALGGFMLRAPSRPAQAFNGLAGGSYSVNVQLPVGWQLSAITCDGDTDAGSVVTLATAQVAIDLDAGEAITCRFAPAGDDAPPLPARRVYLPYLGRR